jgi:hypothetical protein
VGYTRVVLLLGCVLCEVRALGDETALHNQERERECGIGHGYYGDRHVTATWILVIAQQGRLGYGVLHFSIEMPTFQGKFCLHF